MIKYRKITIEKDIPDKVICDFCDKIMEVNECDSFEGTSFELKVGYGSIHDTEHWSFDICDACAEKIHLKTLRNKNIL